MKLSPDELLNRKWPTLSIGAKIDARKPADILVLPTIEGQKPSAPKEWSEEIALVGGEFTGKEGQLIFLYKNGKKEKRLALLGLGKKEKIDKRSLQKAFYELSSKLNEKEYSTVSIAMPAGTALSTEEAFQATSDGLLLGSYIFPFHKGKSKEKEKKRVSTFELLGLDQKWSTPAKEREIVAKAVFFSQDLINANADTVTPTFLGKCAEAIAKKHKEIKVKVWSKKQIEKAEWGLFLAVNQGSVKTEPVVIEANYQTKQSKKSPHTLLVGKGITFDTGGLNIKPTGGMETMKCDMSGAAISLATMWAAAMLKLPTQLSILIPSTENGIGPDSFKPGDVFTSFLGKTVEITNTDAEGRLILADALAWGEQNLKPDQIVDIATLTGSCAVALGPECAGLFSNNDKLAKKLLDAGVESGENIWRLPLIESYGLQLKSHIADMVNAAGREGGAIIAALFLRNFVNKTPWAHLDIAGCAYTKYVAPPYPKHATGYGVRLLVDFLKS